MEIKDSGSRREFSTGAVRDDNCNKGRCDLMPMEVVFKMLACDSIITAIHSYLQKNQTGYLYTAMDLFRVMHYEGSAETMLLEVARQFEDGARKYGEHNWQKGIPTSVYIDSAIRHYLKFRRGDKDEPHDRAFIWNLMCCIWETDHHTYTEGK